MTVYTSELFQMSAMIVGLGIVIFILEGIAIALREILAELRILNKEKGDKHG